jgi:hypothetical protein
MAVAMVEMPDPVIWVAGYRSRGDIALTAREARNNHTASF